MTITLNELTGSIEVLEATGREDLPVSGLAYHSERVKPGIFLSVSTAKNRRPPLPAAAAARGHAAIVEQVQPDLEIPQCGLRQPPGAGRPGGPLYDDHPRGSSM